MLTDYSHLTETTDSKVSREQLQRMVTRYRFATEYCEGKDVLEAGCGVGQGLGILARVSKKLVAEDYTENLVRCAKNYYGSRVEIRRFDAQEMPFDDKSFDVVILYEAIYYLPQPEKFIMECRRVLRSNGNILICTANKDWSGFARSSSSHQYFSAPELHQLLESSGFSAELFGDCPVKDGSLQGAITHAIRKVAVKMNLIPDNMKAREKFKRLFFGRLLNMPSELKYHMERYVKPVQISHCQPNTQHKVLFAVGSKIN
jgi:ubiquinone/menaquinone biosynthesis C-methylase UbiE